MTRSDSQQPHKGAPHDINATEANSRGHLLETFIGAFELAARCLYANLNYVLRWSGANLSSKHALEISYAHRHAIGEILDRQFCLKVIGDPDLQLADRHHL